MHSALIRIKDQWSSVLFLENQPVASIDRQICQYSGQRGGEAQRGSGNDSSPHEMVVVDFL